MYRLYYELLISKVLRYDMCKHGITHFYLPPTRLSTTGMSHICLCFPAAALHSPLVGTLWVGG